jgi:hypothetical protein
MSTIDKAIRDYTGFTTTTNKVRLYHDPYQEMYNDYSAAYDYH